MADLKISQLSSATALAGTETVPVVQGGSTKKATIDQILAPASGKGIDFAAAGGDTLTIYDEGTWTPSFGGTTTYYGRAGTYTRIGRLVFVDGFIHIDTNGTGSQTTISGLPFTPASSRDGIVFAYNTSLGTNIVSLNGRVETGSVIVMYSRTAAATASAANNLCANGAYFEFSGCYYV